VSWLPIPSATGATYQPGALTTATSYRRITVVTMDEGSLCESGPTAAVRITVSPSDGPIANDDFVSTAADTPITFDPIANDRQGSLPIDAASVRFIDPENGNEVVFLEIQGEGTWEIDPFTGGVTFSPETGF